jgi:hypothetical protein
MAEVPAHVWFDPNTGRLQVTITSEENYSHRPEIKTVNARFEYHGGWHCELALWPGKPTVARDPDSEQHAKALRRAEQETSILVDRVRAGNITVGDFRPLIEAFNELKATGD